MCGKFLNSVHEKPFSSVIILGKHYVKNGLHLGKKWKKRPKKVSHLLLFTYKKWTLCWFGASAGSRREKYRLLLKMSAILHGAAPLGDMLFFTSAYFTTYFLHGDSTYWTSNLKTFAPIVNIENDASQPSTSSLLTILFHILKYHTS